jgi:hypothetical protein
MDKNSFLIYIDYQEQFELLTDEQAGKLIKAIIEYEKTGKILELDGMTKMAFSFIKTQLDRDREKWQEEKQKRSEAGKRGMSKRWGKTKQDNNVTNVITEDNKNNSVKNEITNITDNVDVDEDVNVEVDVNKKEKKKRKIFKKPTVKEIQEYCNERHNFINAQHFFDYYESNGWKVGKNSMRDWQATIRNWERRNKSNQTAEEEFLNE